MRRRTCRQYLGLHTDRRPSDDLIHQLPVVDGEEDPVEEGNSLMINLRSSSDDDRRGSTNE